MCGRFTLTWDEWRRVVDALGIDDEGEAAASYRPRFNIAPTDEHFIVTSEYERRKVQRARWGLVNRWAKDNSRASQCINAKAETLEQRSAFKEAFQQRRCVVPGDGFFEWTGPKINASRSGSIRRKAASSYSRACMSPGIRHPINPNKRSPS
jgi:putative SOS response-associated peptidase YedK